MKDPRTPLAAGALLLAAASFWAPTPAAAEPAPLVVELFTSQGCNSCPPADALLGELTEQADLLPLSFHVTYWDRLGWPDSFGLEASTRRQQAYARSLGLGGLYTPQMVVGGRLDAVGSERRRVLEGIALLRAQPEPGPTLAIEGDRLRLDAGDHGPCSLWLLAFDRAHDVAIERGENRGRTLRYHNVVRSIERLGTWAGAPTELTLPVAEHAAAGRDGLAILLQRDQDGAILTAARIDLPPG